MLQVTLLLRRFPTHSVGLNMMASYQLTNNKKEVYFRLTDSGLKVLEGHREHHAKINAAFFDFVTSQATESDIQAIMEFMDVIISSLEPVVSRKTAKRAV